MFGITFKKIYMKIETIKKIIKKALEELVAKDDDIFKQKLPKLGKSTEKERKLNRELHETALNHRFAFYLENGLIVEELTTYNVDIEYNRNFSNLKSVKIRGLKIPVRPDILIHKRMKSSESDPNLLIIEAKKGKSSGHDIEKVKAFMNDMDYNYKFGLTVSYAYKPNQVEAIFYYKSEDNKIKTDPINVKRKSYS
jgi:hypothetical protein